MAKPLVSDALWAVVAPLVPPHHMTEAQLVRLAWAEGPRKPGRTRVPDRACLTGSCSC
jgi:transposase